jgi:hypothetical protein
MMDQEDPGGTAKIANRSWDTPSKERAGVLLSGRAVPSGPSSCPYSPECVDGRFCELRLYGVLGSALRKDLLQLYLLSREPFTLSQGRYLPPY